MYTNDFILRQIELFAKALRKESVKEDFMETRASDDDDNLIVKLYDLVDEGKLCEAEDELFFYCQNNPSAEVFGVAVEFYNMLDSFSDEELNRYDFPRSDIAKGLSALILLINNR